MRTSKNPLAIQSQKWIFDSFTKLLLSVAYDDISVSMICSDAEIDRRTFYRYFDNKQDVLQSYMQLIAGEYLECVAELKPHNETSLLRFFFDFWSGDHRTFLYALERNKLLHTAFDRNADYMKRLEELFDSTLGRSTNCFESAFRIGGLVSVLSCWIAGGFAESSAEMTALVARVLR